MYIWVNGSDCFTYNFFIEIISFTSYGFPCEECAGEVVWGVEEDDEYYYELTDGTDTNQVKFKVIDIGVSEGGFNVHPWLPPYLKCAWYSTIWTSIYCRDDCTDYWHTEASNDKYECYNPCEQVLYAWDYYWNFMFVPLPINLTMLNYSAYVFFNIFSYNDSVSMIGNDGLSLEINITIGNDTASVYWEYDADGVL
ncbi:unnamed protein product, partial [marine sediment metagenome]